MIQMTSWPFFYQRHGQGEVPVASLDITWEANIAAQLSTF